MGGYGSGRRNYRLKTLVEDCFSLSVNSLRKDLIRVDSDGGKYHGTVYWTIRGKRVGDMGYRVYKKNSLLMVQLIYRSTNTITEEVRELDYSIRVQHTNVVRLKNWTHDKYSIIVQGGKKWPRGDTAPLVQISSLIP